MKFKTSCASEQVRALDTDARLRGSAGVVANGEKIVLIGRPGRGKRLLAMPAAHRYTQSGFGALFVTAAKMIDHLSGAAAQGRRTDVLSRDTRAELLVMDELGYINYCNYAANMLVDAVSDDRSSSHSSMIFTKNKNPNDRGAVLPHHDLAAAIADRPLERGPIIARDNPSMRLQHFAPDAEIGPMVPQQADRVSGKHLTGVDARPLV